MKIHQFSQLGKRGNNEDSLGSTAGLLTVCDGIGGHVSGERASSFVVQAMLHAFAEPEQIGKMEIQQQLNKVHTDLNQLLEKEPELEKMGTTFTGVFITPDVWYAAHIGDSRIYLFRPSERKLWHTWDHSPVGELMRTHEITVEAGRFHPLSNRISKAIIAQRDGKPAGASVVKIDELKAGDIFLLCSDGVVEGWGDLELVKLFSDDSLSFEQQCEKLRQQCEAKSKDNNTALIALIEDNDAFSYGSNEELEWTSFDEVEADYQQYLKDHAEQGEPEQEPAEDSPENKPAPQSESQPEAQPQPQPEPKPQSEPEPMVLPKPQPESLDLNRKKSARKTKMWLLLILLLILLGIGAFLLFGGGSHQEGTTQPDAAQTKETTSISNGHRASTPESDHGDKEIQNKEKPNVDQSKTNDDEDDD